MSLKDFVVGGVYTLVLFLLGFALGLFTRPQYPTHLTITDGSVLQPDVSKARTLNKPAVGRQP
mgnify:CR=1 FL=1